MTGAGRQVVLISGPPAAGKATIAGPLAAELGFALLAKDRIKEALHDALGLEPDLAWSRCRRRRQRKRLLRKPQRHPAGPACPLHDRTIVR